MLLWWETIVKSVQSLPLNLMPRCFPEQRLGVEKKFLHFKEIAPNLQGEKQNIWDTMKRITMKKTQSIMK